jgi:hypothetical protein
MVDLILLQTVSYIAAATSVCLAALYYALNLREANRNRRMALTTSLMQSFISEEGVKRFMDLANMQWTDFDDYYRVAYWNACEVLGYQYREGIIDIGTLNAACTQLITTIWAKFKPIIEEYRKFDYAKNTYENWEHLANEMNRTILERDPTYRGPQRGLGGDAYEKAFKR